MFTAKVTITDSDNNERARTFGNIVDANQLAVTLMNIATEDFMPDGKRLIIVVDFSSPPKADPHPGLSNDELREETYRANDEALHPELSIDEALGPGDILNQFAEVADWALGPCPRCDSRHVGHRHSDNSGECEDCGHKWELAPIDTFGVDRNSRNSLKRKE